MLQGQEMVHEFEFFEENVIQALAGHLVRRIDGSLQPSDVAIFKDCMRGQSAPGGLVADSGIPLPAVPSLFRVDTQSLS